MDIAIANIHLRTADRVFIKMAEFEARSFEELIPRNKGSKMERNNTCRWCYACSWKVG